MLNDIALRSLKPKEKPYKVIGGGMHAAASTTGVISFRYDYRLNGRRETLTKGRRPEAMKNLTTGCLLA